MLAKQGEIDLPLLQEQLRQAGMILDPALTRPVIIISEEQA